MPKWINPVVIELSLIQLWSFIIHLWAALLFSYAPFLPLFLTCAKFTCHDGVVLIKFPCDSYICLADNVHITIVTENVYRNIIHLCMTGEIYLETYGKTLRADLGKIMCHVQLLISCHSAPSCLQYQLRFSIVNEGRNMAPAGHIKVVANHAFLPCK